MRERSTSRFFDTGHLRQGLGRRSARASAVTLASQLSRFGLTLVSTMVFARLLEPEDFGVVAMATAITGFIGSLSDFGLSTATVQHEEIDHGEVSTLFWLNGAVSLLLALLVHVAAPLIAGFYQNPEIEPVARALGWSIFVTGLGIQHTALLRRQMMFRELAILQVSAQFVGLAIGVAVALRDGGYWALVAATLGTAACTTLGTFWTCRWIPGRPVFSPKSRAMISFGGNLAGFTLVNFVTRNADNALLGRFAGSAQLGIYSRAYSLLLLPVRQVNGPIGAIAVPALSRLQNEPGQFAQYYYRMVRIVAFLSMPLAVLLAVLAEDVIWIVLGPKWEECVPLFRIFAAFAVFQPLIQTCGWVMIARGQADRQLRWGILQACVAVPVFWFGASGGALGMTLAATGMALAMMIPAARYAFAESPIELRALLRATARPALVSALLVAAILPASLLLDDVHAFWRVGAVSAVAALTFGVLLLSWGSLRTEMVETARLFQQPATSGA